MNDEDYKKLCTSKNHHFDWNNKETNPWIIMTNTSPRLFLSKESHDWYSIAHWTVYSILRMDTNFKNERAVNISAHKSSIATMKKAQEEIKDLKSELYDTKRDNKNLEEDNKRLEKENKRLYKEMCRFRKELNLRKAGLK